jgi:SSS family solute:Na+ symporter
MNLTTIDLLVLLLYVCGIVAFGSWFMKKSRTSSEFTTAGRALPGWAVGLSIFGTFLSSNTFLGVPGKAFGSNWNSFVFSLTLPIAAFFAARYFVPFYRESGFVSAYQHLEFRFGIWARIYADICYLLTHIARVGSILFGASLGVSALLGWDIRMIILVSGFLVTLYTFLGGIEAVIWTDVIQSIVLTFGAILVLFVIFLGMPDGPFQAIEIAQENAKFSLGSMALNFSEPTFWVVLFYGIFINLGNFGIDQSFVQRYLTAKTDGEAKKSVWLGGLLYIPVSMLFFLIGSTLFSFYSVHPEALNDLKDSVVVSQGLSPGTVEIENIADRAFPHFIASRFSGGFAGLLIAAIFAAAMSSMDTSLNSSATVVLEDFYKRFFNSRPTETQSMRVLYLFTAVFGVLGTGLALAMVGVKSLLDAWWGLQGIFSGGILGLFLLGIISRRATSKASMISVLIGVCVIAWLTLSIGSEFIPLQFRSPLHTNMTIVVGTLVIFLVGTILSLGSKRNRT